MARSLMARQYGISRLDDATSQEAGPIRCYALHFTAIIGCTTKLSRVIRGLVQLQRRAA